LSSASGMTSMSSSEVNSENFLQLDY